MFKNGTTFSESYYINNNPDVAAAVAAGEFASGLQHFEQFGQTEGRTTSATSFDPATFDENFYLANNQDVADAIASGLFSSALEHFLSFGQAEGRAPNSGAILSLNPPTANGDLATTDEDTSTNINVLINDTDPENDPLTVVSVGNTSQGSSVSINGNGTINYDPSNSAAIQSLGAGVIGTDTFTYTIDDGTSTDTANVVVFVVGVNDAPVANTDTANVFEDGAPLSILPLLNDSDPESDPITITGINTTGTVGSVNISGNFINYAQGNNFQTLRTGDTAVDTFTYTIDDGNGATDTATVTITINGVNDAPTLGADSGTTDENTSINIAVLSNDTDIEGHSLTIASAGPTSVAGATITINGNTIDYDPVTSASLQTLDNGQTATDSFTYTVSDGNGGTSTATVTVTVSGVNVAPTANADSELTDEDNPVTIDVVSNDTDADGDPLTVGAVDTTGTTGTVTNNGTDVTYDPNGSFESLAQGVTATDSFSYTTDDNSGGTATATVTVTITGVNDAPTALADNAATDENTAINITVLANDTDPDTGDVLSVSAGPSAQGATVTVNGNTIDYDPSTSASIQSLTTGQSTSDTFTYTIDDGNGGTSTATVTVVVSGISDPTAGDDSIPGSSGDDSIDALAGNDSVDGNDGNDTIDGGDGNDSINGGNGLDILSGGLGNDTIRGNADSDTINGGDGDDLILGDSDDSLAAFGDDSINGGDGNDRIGAGNGNDTINGGSGDDWILGAHGDDLINGGDGNDSILNGSNGNDTVNGNDGDDFIVGNNGDDTVTGGNGNDTLRGNSGNDVLSGGSGADNFVFSVSDTFQTPTQQDTITDFSISDGDVIEVFLNPLGISSFNDISVNSGVIDFTGTGMSALLGGTSDTNLSASDFIFH